jgi:hypothetical protein
MAQKHADPVPDPDPDPPTLVLTQKIVLKLSDI